MVNELYAIVDRHDRVIDIYNPEFTSMQPAIFRTETAAKMHINRIRDTENSMRALRIVKMEV